MTPRTSRRNLVASVAMVRAGAALLASAPSGYAALTRTQAEDPTVGEATMPAWRFVVHEMQDPYDGELRQPREPDPDLRYLGADIEILNDSDAALNFSASHIRLLDKEGNEYPSRGAKGQEPELVNINLLPRTETRGWIWFSVPEDTEVAGLVYVAPSPRLMVPLSNDPSSTPSAATPTS